MKETDWMDDAERDENWFVEFVKALFLTFWILILAFFASLFILWVAYF